MQMLLLAAPLYCYVWLRIGPHLVHHRFMSRMLGLPRGWDHFVRMLPEPGGLVTYLTGHLFQYYAYPWLGALVITAALVALGAATVPLLGAARGSWWRLAAFVPPIALLGLLDRYQDPMRLCLAVLAAALAANVYVRVLRDASWWRLVLFAAVATAVFFAAGSACLLAFALYAAAVEFRSRRRLLAGVCAAGGLAAFAAIVPAGLDPTMASPLPGADVTADSLVPHVAGGRAELVVMAILAVLYLLVALSGRKPAAEKSPSANAPAGPAPDTRAARRLARRKAPARPDGAARPWLRHPALHWGLQTVLVLLVAAVVAGVAFDADLRLWLDLGYAFRHREWADVLEGAARLPIKRYNPLVQHDVDRALYHTGRLPHDMFSYPQMPLGLLLMVYKNKYHHSMFHTALYERIADTFYELGRLNDAEHWTHEMLQMQGDMPWLLRRLATINVAKRQPEAARVFLGYVVSLHNDLETERWARDCLRRLDADPDLSDDAEICRLRECRLTNDVYRWTQQEHEYLLDLLARNPHNRMAFEYLMASYLLNGNLAGFVEDFHRLDDFDYAELPRHYQEAVMVYRFMGGRDFDMGRWRISGETMERFRDFAALCNSTDRREREARYQAIRGTYFHYYYKIVILPRLKQ